MRLYDVDLLCIHGHGFPAYRGGPLFHADQLGLPAVYESILGYQKQLGTESWAPAPFIERLIAQGQGFYSGASGSALAS